MTQSGKRASYSSSDVLMNQKGDDKPGFVQHGLMKWSSKRLHAPAYYGQMSQKLIDKCVC